MITKISSTRNGQVVYHFSNGVILSFLWSDGSYTENHSRSETAQQRRKLVQEGKLYEAELLEWESKTVEIYSMGTAHSELSELFESKYDGNPAVRVPVSEIPHILAMADKGDS